MCLNESRDFGQPNFTSIRYVACLLYPLRFNFSIPTDSQAKLKVFNRYYLHT